MFRSGLAEREFKKLVRRIGAFRAKKRAKWGVEFTGEDGGRQQSSRSCKKGFMGLSEQV